MIFSEILILFVTIQLTIIILLADPSENAIYGKSITLRVQLLLHPASCSRETRCSLRKFGTLVHYENA